MKNLGEFDMYNNSSSWRNNPFLYRYGIEKKLHIISNFDYNFQFGWYRRDFICGTMDI